MLRKIQTKHRNLAEVTEILLRLTRLLVNLKRIRLDHSLEKIKFNFQTNSMLFVYMYDISKICFIG